MAYPIIKDNYNFFGTGLPDGNAMTYFLKKYPTKTKGQKSKSQKSRANRRKK